MGDRCWPLLAGAGHAVLFQNRPSNNRRVSDLVQWLRKKAQWQPVHHFWLCDGPIAWCIDRHPIAGLAQTSALHRGQAKATCR